MSGNSEFAITHEEAYSFLHGVLNLIPPTLNHENQEDYIADIMKAMLHHLPFQTVKAISTSPEERHQPTAAEIKEDAFTRLGGGCLTLNTFCWMLLRALDFEVSLVPCDLREHKNVHVAVIAHNLTKGGSKHLVDVGNGYPTFRPIPLDFEEASPIYRDSFLRYRFIREGNTITRLHDVETDPGRKKEFEKWMKDGWYYYLLVHLDKSVDITYFQDTMNKIYTEPGNGITPFLISLRCLAFPNGRFRCIKDTTLLVEEEAGVVKKAYLKSRNELLAAFAQYFPQFTTDMVKAAMADNNVKLDFTRRL